LPFKKGMTVSDARARELYSKVFQEENISEAMDEKWSKLNLQAPYTYNEAIASKVWTQELMSIKFRRPELEERSSGLLSIV
jgi:hypothetical protein